MLPWKRHRLLLGRPLLVTEYQSTTKSVGPLKLFSIKFTFCVRRSSERTVIFLMLLPIEIYLGRWSPQINLIKTIKAVFEKIAILCFWADVKSPYFWNWNVQIHRLSNMNTISPIVQVLATRTYVHTYSIKTLFHIQGAQNV
jgi:hypothetical protein